MINRLNIYAVIVSVALFLGGCMMPRASVENLADVDKAKDVIMVGQIDIVPKIQKEDVSVKMALGADELYRQFMLRIRNDIGETTDYMTDMENMAVVKTEEDFYVPSSRSEPFQLFGGWFYTKLHGGNGVSASVVFFHLTDGLKVEIPKNAGAIYLGTIKFRRDEFFNLKDIDIEQNDYEAAQRRFQKKFKTSMPLIKAKITHIRRTT